MEKRARPLGEGGPDDTPRGRTIRRVDLQPNCSKRSSSINPDHGEGHQGAPRHACNRAQRNVAEIGFVNTATPEIRNRETYTTPSPFRAKHRPVPCAVKKDGPRITTPPLAQMNNGLQPINFSRGKEMPKPPITTSRYKQGGIGEARPIYAHVSSGHSAYQRPPGPGGYQGRNFDLNYQRRKGKAGGKRSRKTAKNR